MAPSTARAEQAVEAPAPGASDQTSEILAAASRPDSGVQSAASSRADTGDRTSAAAPVVPEERTVDRSRFYVSQMGDRNLGSGGLFGCGATSLVMALSDFNVAGYSHPPTEEQRQQVMVSTKVMQQGQFPGGPDLMATEAQKHGLNAIGREGCTDIKVLDQELGLGRGVIVNGPNHFVYIAGKADDGSYIVGDPANPGVTRWSADTLQNFMSGSGRGFTSVWGADSNGQPRFVTNDGGAGNVAAPAVDRGGESAIGQPSGGGGNGSMFGGDNSGMGGGIPQRLPDTPPGVATGTPSESENDFYNSLPPDEHLLMSSLTDKIVGGISKNEGSFNSINRNDAGHGISVGMMQWNQRVGGLPDLLQRMLEEDPELFKKLFPDLFAEFVGADGKIDANKLRKFDFTGSEKGEAMLSQLKEGLVDPKMKNVQIAMARESVVAAEKIGINAGFKSELGLAIICDAVNQAGQGGVQSALTRAGVTPEKIAQIGEAEAIKLFERSLGRPGAEQRDAALAAQFNFATVAV